mmetsp:Transcript_35640/g.113968  ORF Transcript_35640/g.113968 Transcript_35640/m.113968 type:complete len:113 (-) Transcript_35640:258-596(-)
MMLRTVTKQLRGRGMVRALGSDPGTLAGADWKRGPGTLSADWRMMHTQVDVDAPTNWTFLKEALDPIEAYIGACDDATKDTLRRELAFAATLARGGLDRGDAAWDATWDIAL